MTSPSTGPLPLDPAAFGLSPRDGPITLLQTHIGWVYLAGDYAFKLKKQVRFDFLDFTTLAQRQWACEREIRLNSRLAPGLYLGLRPVYETRDGQRILGGPEFCVPVHAQRIDWTTFLKRLPAGSKLIDWAVWMKRLPDDRMLDVLLARNAVATADAEAIAGVLAPFYTQARGKTDAGGLGDLAAVRANVEENLREGRSLSRDILPEGELKLIAARANHFLHKHGELIQLRAKQGYVVDGHGDLRSENICLPPNEPPVLFDCIEFNDRFRVCDSALDIAFLAMDFDARGRGDLSAALLAAYRRSVDPYLPEKLLSFYLGYRAFVKGKVAAWIARDKDVADAQRKKSTDDARRLFELAVRYALKNEPALILFCGIAGSGKSTLARSLAARLGATHLATDLLRDEIVPRGTARDIRYSRENTDKVYALLRERAAAALRKGETVIADGTFVSAELRRAVQAEAAAAHVPALLVWADPGHCNLTTRLQERGLRNEAFGSEADGLVSIKQAQKFETPAESEGFLRIVRVETVRPLSDTNHTVWEEVLQALARQYKTSDF